MFNVGGGEVVVIALIALIVLGPQRLPDAARQIGKTLGDLRRLSSGFQDELRSALDDPNPDPAPRRDVLGSAAGTASASSADRSASAALRAVSDELPAGEGARQGRDQGPDEGHEQGHGHGGDERADEPEGVEVNGSAPSRASTRNGQGAPARARRRSTPLVAEPSANGSSAPGASDPQQEPASPRAPRRA